MLENVTWLCLFYTNIYFAEKNEPWGRLLLLTLCHVFAALKEERYRYDSGFDKVEDVIGVAQPVRFNSKLPNYPCPTDLCILFFLPCAPLVYPQRNARVDGTTTRRRPAVTKFTWGMRTSGRLWTLVRKSMALWLRLSPTRSCSSSLRSRWTLTTKCVSAETSASEYIQETNHQSFLKCTYWWKERTHCCVCFKVLGWLPVCDHQSEPLIAGAMGGGI